jgi:hypothetical protein
MTGRTRAWGTILGHRMPEWVPPTPRLLRQQYKSAPSHPLLTKAPRAPRSSAPHTALGELWGYSALQGPSGSCLARVKVEGHDCQATQPVGTQKAQGLADASRGSQGQSYYAQGLPRKKQSTAHSLHPWSPCGLADPGPDLKGLPANSGERVRGRGTQRCLRHE